MSHPTSFLVGAVAALTLSPFTSAQRLVETFDGPNLPASWMVRSGSWAIANQRAVLTSGSTSFMTMPGIKLLNCVVDADVYWAGTPAVQLGGVCARFAAASPQDVCFVKVQSNSATVSGFDTLWSYEYPPGTATSRTAISPVMTKTRIRLMIVGNQGWLQLDSTQSGVFDMLVGPRTYTAHTVAGEVGIVGFSSGGVSTSIDNFALFDAVLMDDGSTTPKIGTTHAMTLTTQATQVTPFVCAAALGNGGTKNGSLGGLPIGGGRFIPLAADPVLDLSLALGGALGLVGVTDASGVGKPKLVIPNMQALVGIELHIAGVTAGGPTGIENISNNHYVKIVQ